MTSNNETWSDVTYRSCCQDIIHVIERLASTKDFLVSIVEKWIDKSDDFFAMSDVEQAIEKIDEVIEHLNLHNLDKK